MVNMFHYLNSWKFIKRNLIFNQSKKYLYVILEKFIYFENLILIFIYAKCDMYMIIRNNLFLMENFFKINPQSFIIFYIISIKNIFYNFYILFYIFNIYYNRNKFNSMLDIHIIYT